MDFKQDMELSKEVMVENIKGNGKIINFTERDYFNGPMEKVITEIIMKTLKQVTVVFNGQMAKYTRVIGLIVYKMEKANI